MTTKPYKPQEDRMRACAAKWELSLLERLKPDPEDDEQHPCPTCGHRKPKEIF